MLPDGVLTVGYLVQYLYEFNDYYAILNSLKSLKYENMNSVPIRFMFFHIILSLTSPRSITTF